MNILFRFLFAFRMCDERRPYELVLPGAESWKEFESGRMSRKTVFYGPIVNEYCIVKKG